VTGTALSGAAWHGAFPRAASIRPEGAGARFGLPSDALCWPLAGDMSAFRPTPTLPPDPFLKSDPGRIGVSKPRHETIEFFAKKGDSFSSVTIHLGAYGDPTRERPVPTWE
jgi:hypothetical protein